MNIYNTTAKTHGDMVKAVAIKQKYHTLVGIARELQSAVATDRRRTTVVVVVEVVVVDSTQKTTAMDFGQRTTVVG